LEAVTFSCVLAVEISKAAMLPSWYLGPEAIIQPEPLTARTCLSRLNLLYKRLKNIYGRVEMDLKRLRAFYLVSRYGSLAKAAHHLQLTASAISVQLKNLESEYSVRLFDRYPNKLVLTEKGRVLLKDVRQVFDLLDRMQEKIAEDPNVFAGSVKIGLGRDLAKFFAPQIAAVKQANPKLHIAILSINSEEAMPRLLEGELDIVINRVAKVPRGIAKRKLLNSKLYLVFPRGHPIGKKAKISLADIAQYPLILNPGGSNTRRVIDLGFSDSNIELKNVVEVSTCEAIVEFVKLSVGIGIVHDICLFAGSNTNLSGYELTRQFKSLEISLVYRKPSELIPSHRALMDTIISSAARTKRISEV
jgi:DNA-binding transcriptional LysR family regulator